MRPVKIPTDSEIQKIAKILVEHSARVKKGDYVQIVAGIPARDLVLEVYKQIIQKGAYPVLKADFEGLSYLYYKYASEEQLKNFPKIAFHEMKNSDAVIYIAAPENRYELATISPDPLTLRQKTIRKIFEERLKKKWVIFDYPVPDFAKDAGMSLPEYRKFVFESCMQDWEKLSVFMKKVKKVIDEGKKVRIKTPNTDLTFGINGRLGAIGNGTCNMPDGEVWTAPEENTEGHINFTYPLERMGRFHRRALHRRTFHPDPTSKDSSPQRMAQGFGQCRSAGLRPDAAPATQRLFTGFGKRVRADARSPE